MKRFAILAVCVIAAGCFQACQSEQSRRIDATLEWSGANRAEWEQMLHDYEHQQADPLKREAARFLVAGLGRHVSHGGEPLARYKELVYANPIPQAGDTLRVLWERAQQGNGVVGERHDAVTLTAADVSGHLEGSFEAWQSAPWREEVSFADYCRYVLPYRVNGEPFVSGWSDSLRARYNTLVAGVKSVKQAYLRVMQHLDKTFREIKPACPHIPDVLMLDRLRAGVCRDKCILTAAVCRALGIPVAYDYVSHWTNYSTMGHSWVSLVLGDSTFTWETRDTVVRPAGRIPASRFAPEYTPGEDYLYRMSEYKRVAKVYRSAFDIPEGMDVSAVYGLDCEIDAEVEGDAEVVYLCTFRTGKDWHPVDAAPVRRGRVRFAHIGGGTAYLLMRETDGRYEPVSAPILVHEDGRTEMLCPDTLQRERAVLLRKYPLFAQWTNQWHKMVGGRLEAANRPDFADAVLLDSLAATPVYRNEFSYPTAPGQRYRYLRYVCPDNCRTPLAELEVYADGGQERAGGTSIGSDFLTPALLARPFDGNRMSVCSTKRKYWVGLDLQRPRHIDRIVLYPKNDGNFVEPGDRYALFYYDRGWHPLGECVADGFALTYEVPAHALLWLRNLSKGKEERIFTYEGGKQRWW